MSRRKADSDQRTAIYTDGACSGNPGPGGWAWVIPGGRYRSGADEHTTNQRMELAAALDAVRSVDGPLEIVSDSTYVVNCFRDGWWKGWRRRGWVNSKKQPVANRDLWEPLVEIYQARSITFRWVKGHGGDRWNEAADRLAVQASMAQQGVEGDGALPEDLSLPEGRRPTSRAYAKPAGGGWRDGLDRTEVYTHGAASGYSGPAGWAWMAPGERYRSGAEPRATGPRMELMAVVEAVRGVDGPLEIVSDSTYVVNCFRSRWWKDWMERGWVNSKNKPVANRDLWEPLIEMYQERAIGFRMAGAGDDHWSKAVEWLATEASRTQQGAEGGVTPAEMP